MLLIKNLPFGKHLNSVFFSVLIFLLMSDSVFADLYSSLGKVSVNSQNKNLKIDGDVFGDKLLFSVSGKNFLYQFDDSTGKLTVLKEFNSTPEKIRKGDATYFGNTGGFIVSSETMTQFWFIKDDFQLSPGKILTAFQNLPAVKMKDWLFKNYGTLILTEVPVFGFTPNFSGKVADSSILNDNNFVAIFFTTDNGDGTYSAQILLSNGLLMNKVDFTEKPKNVIDNGFYTVAKKLMYREQFLKEFTDTPHYLKQSGHFIYFFVDNDSGTKFCKYDITYNAENPFKMLKSFNLSPESVPVEMGDKLYYVMSGQSGFELWQTDLASDVSSLVSELSSVTEISRIGSMKLADNLIYFSVTDKTDCTTLWKSDGTAEGTGEITGTALASPFAFNVINSHALYLGSAHGGLPALCYTDGETLRSLSSLEYNAEKMNTSMFREWNKKVIFNVLAPSVKRGIWISDLRDQSEMISGTEGMNFNKIIFYDDDFYFFTDSACYYSDGEKSEKLFDGTDFEVLKKNGWLKVEAKQDGDKVVYLCGKGKAHKITLNWLGKDFVNIDNEQFITSLTDDSVLGVLTLDNKFTPLHHPETGEELKYTGEEAEFFQKVDNLAFFTASKSLFVYDTSSDKLIDLNEKLQLYDDYSYRLVQEIIPLQDFYIVGVNSKIYKMTKDFEFIELMDLYDNGPGSYSKMFYPQISNGKLYFYDGDGYHFDTVYVTDGTPEGSGIVANGVRHHNVGPCELIAFNDRLVVKREEWGIYGFFRSYLSPLLFDDEEIPWYSCHGGMDYMVKYNDGLMFGNTFSYNGSPEYDEYSLSKTDGTSAGLVYLNIPQYAFNSHYQAVYKERFKKYYDGSLYVNYKDRIINTCFCYQTDSMAVPAGFIPSFVSEISPSCGLTSGGNIVTINGNYLGNGSDITEVTFNGEKAEIIEQSETSVKVRVPSVSEDGWAAVKIVSESCSITVSGLKYKFTNDSAEITVNKAEIAEDGGIAVVTATLQTPVDKDTEIGFSITGSADQNEDYELSASSIVIPAGETTGSITITAIADDLYDESDEVIELAPVYISGAVPAYDTLLSITIKNDLPVYTVTYSADESAAGYIIGQKEQSIAYGEDTLPVFAVANPGYIFTGWSDSKTSNPRVDSNVISDLHIEAIFEKVAPKLFDVSGKIIGDKTVSVTVSAVSLLTGETVAVAVSDEAGSFVFENLSSGVYEISVVIPDGYTGTPDVIRVYTDKLDSGNNIIFKITKIPPDVVKLVIPENDEYSLLAGNTLTVPTPGVLENDEIPEGISVEIVVTKKPLHGALTFKEDGSFEYKPDALYFGNDKFVYALKSKNGTLSNSAEVTIKIAPEMISVGSLISLKDFAASQDDVKAMRMKVYGAVDNRNYRLRINTKGDNGVNAVWVKRLRLINFRPGKSNIDNLKLATQAKSVEITLKTKDNKKLISKALFVPPQIEKISVTGSELSLIGSYFGPKAPKVYLVSKSDKTFIRCKVSKKDYAFDAATGKSLLKAEIQSNRVKAGKYSIVLFNRVGIGVTEENILPVADIK